MTRTPLGLLAAVARVGHGDRDAILEQDVDLAVRGFQAHGRAVAGQFIDGSGDGLGRQRRDSAASSAARRRGTSTTSPLVSRPSVPPAPKISSSADTVSPAERGEQPDGGLLDELVFGVGVGFRAVRRSGLRKLRQRHAARKSTCTASNGNSRSSSGVLRRMPARRSACASAWTALTSRPTRRAASEPLDLAGHALDRPALGSQHLPQQLGGGEADPRSRIRLPLFQMRTKSAAASRGLRTSSVTVFIEPPLNIREKIGDKSLRRREPVTFLDIAHVAVVALSRLVVVTQLTGAVDYERQPMLAMRASANG